MNCRILTVIGIILLTASCRQENFSECFTVKGKIEGAEGRTLYLDWMSLSGIQTVDSVRLDESCAFEFRQPRPECYDFYRIRVDGKVVNLSIDSTETVSVTATLKGMNTDYVVAGSENCARLKELVLLQMGLQQEISRMAASAGAETGVLQMQVDERVDVFKSEIANKYIYSGVDKPYAYYALFMHINGVPLFNPQKSRQDAKYFASVATTMDMKYPDAVRIRNLHNIAIKGMKLTSQPAPASEETIDRWNSLVKEAGVLEIELPDVNGVDRRLTDLTGKVVLLDFTAFKTDFSPEYNLALRDLYSKYAESGFEIFQVSVDVDAHFWMTSADNLPWICVHDPESVESEYLSSYNVQSLPTAFLINRSNEIVERVQSMSELDEHIASLLK